MPSLNVEQIHFGSVRCLQTGLGEIITTVEGGAHACLVHQNRGKGATSAPAVLQHTNWTVNVSVDGYKEKWDGAIASRASEGKSLTPASLKAYQAFVDQPYRKLVMNIKTKTYLPRPSAASSEIMKDCLVLELKMSLDPAHLSLRFGCGPFYHLYVRQFQISAEEA